MRLCLVFPAVAVLALAACTSPPPPDNQPAPAVPISTPQKTAAVPAPVDPTLGSPAWYAWVDKSLGVSDAQGHGPDPGSQEWSRAVQHRLGQEAPQAKPGSPEWQQAVDALLRTRLPAASASTQ